MEEAVLNRLKGLHIYIAVSALDKCGMVAALLDVLGVK